jgi:RimJ/RimL family protein N-acetyltransferase
MVNYGFGVSLERISESDLKFMFECRNEPEVYKWCRQNAPLHWKTHLEWFDWQRKDASTEMFSICVDAHCGDPIVDQRITEKVVVGVCGLTGIDKVNGRAEFSLYIAPNYWGKGFGEGSLKTLFKWGFDALRLNRIWGESFEGNTAWGLFEKLGMEKEGVRREHYYRDGRYIDAALFSIGASSFNALHGSKARYGCGLKPVA